MGLLARIGKIFVNVMAVISGVSGTVINSLPVGSQNTAKTVLGDFQAASNLITTAEGMYAALNNGQAGGGADKLKMAAPFIAQLVLQSEPFAGKKIKDNTKFEGGVNSITSGLADVLSSFEA